MKTFIKLTEWAKANRYTYRGAFGLYQNGGIPDTKTSSTGRILVGVENTIPVKEQHNVVYSRVSSSENKSNLESQADRVAKFCNANGWIVHEIIKECASGLNDNRPKLLKLFRERKATRIVVEHKDRLTRFGFNFIKTLYNDCEIVVINEVSDDRNDLIQDFVSIITSFCARLYGNRRSKRATEKLISKLNEEEGS